MAILLTLPQKRKERPVADGEPLGEILFFTGVRIERHDDVSPHNDSGEFDDAQGGSSERRRRKR